MGERRNKRQIRIERERWEIVIEDKRNPRRHLWSPFMAQSVDIVHYSLSVGAAALLKNGGTVRLAVAYW
jgi:hypothetical protein